MKILLLAFLLAATPVERIRLVNTYENIDYAYSVRLPSGTYGLSHYPGTPNHGFQLMGPALKFGTLWVDARYNATFQPDLESIAREHFAPIPLVSTAAVQVTRRSLTVGGIPALRVVLVGSKTVNDAVFVLRPRAGGVGIIYSFVLTASPAEYKASRRYLEELVHAAAFKEHPAA